MPELNIKVLRAQQGLTIKQLATLVGRSQSYLSDIENGNRKCNIDRLEEIANALNVDFFDLFERKNTASTDDIGEKWTLLSACEKDAVINVIDAILHRSR